MANHPGQFQGSTDRVRRSPRTPPGNPGIAFRDRGTHRNGSQGVKRPEMGSRQPYSLRYRCSDYLLAIRTESWAAHHVAVTVRIRLSRTPESPLGIGAPTDMGVTPLFVPKGDSRVPESRPIAQRKCIGRSQDVQEAVRSIADRPRPTSAQDDRAECKTTPHRPRCQGRTTKPANASAWFP